MLQTVDSSKVLLSICCSGSDLVSGQRDQMARPAEIISMYRTFLKHGALNLAKLFDLKGDGSKAFVFIA